METIGVVVEVAGMSWPQVQARAEQLLQRCSPESLTTPGPVPVVDIMHFKLEEQGILFGVEDLPDGTEAKATWNTYAQMPEVLLAPKVYAQMLNGDGRARMTAFHEVGHADLHAHYIRLAGEMSFSPDIVSFSRRRIPPYKNAERQAEVYAGRFLLPERAVLAAIQTLGPDPEALAETFLVSYSAMRVRLGELGVR